MLAASLDFIRSLGDVVRIPDLIDILVIATCIHVAILWLLRRASRGVVAGLSLVAFVYLMARRLDMVMTSLLFQVGFTAIWIGLILVFQRDIRNAFERMGGKLGILGARSGIAAATADIVARSLVRLGRAHIGALLVLPGRTSLDPHIHGGHPLDGRVSEPLLDSIFDPSSDGHDGAMVVTGDRATRFGVHLPLSENLDRLAGRGTRHAAAVGLTEHTDALVLVVSEERGTISVAHGGTLEEVRDADALRERIESFGRETGPVDRDRPGRFASWTGRVRPALVQHWPTKLLSLAVASTLWLTVAYRVEPVVRQLTVPIEFHDLPESLQVKDVRPEEVRLTMSGPKHRFALVDADRLRVSLNLAAAGAGPDTRTLGPENVELPSDDLIISDFSPATVSFTIEARPEPAPP